MDVIELDKIWEVLDILGREECGDDLWDAVCENMERIRVLIWANVYVCNE
jgi:hypothetical protein